jgi:hypothetical protein
MLFPEHAKSSHHSQNTTSHSRITKNLSFSAILKSIHRVMRNNILKPPALLHQEILMVLLGAVESRHGFYA